MSLISVQLTAHSDNQEKSGDFPGLFIEVKGVGCFKFLKIYVLIFVLSVAEFQTITKPLI